MNAPPKQPWPPSSPQAPQQISVGGPNGIVIQGDRVQVGGMVVQPGQGSVRQQGAVPPQPAPIAQVARSQGAGLELELFRNPTRLPRVLMGGGIGMGILAAILALPAMGMSSVAVMAALIAFSSICAALVLGQKAKGLEKKRSLPIEIELGLLELAHRSGGELSVPATARALQIPLDEAQESLTRLAKRGYAELDVGPEGEMVYKISQGAAQTAALPPSR